MDTQAALAALASNNDGGTTANSGVAIDIDALLNQDLDTIADLPDYVNPKEGAYLFTVEKADMEGKVGKDKKRAIIITYVVEQLLELKGTLEGDDVKQGNKFNEMYFMTTEAGAKYSTELLKKLFAPVSQRLGVKTLRETFAGLPGFKIVVQIKREKDRDDPNKSYAKVAKIVVPE